MEEPMKVVLDSLEKNIKDKLYYKSEAETYIEKYSKVSKELEDLSRTVTILKKTVKSFNDFVDEKKLRGDYQEYFENVWLERKENK